MPLPIRARGPAVLAVLAGCVPLLAGAAPGPVPVRLRHEGPTLEAPVDLRGADAPVPRLLTAAGGAPLALPGAGSPTERAEAFVRARVAPAGDLALRDVRGGKGGVQFITFEQQFEGLPVDLGRVTVALDADGRALATLVGELAPLAPLPAPESPALPDAPSARHAAEALLGGAARPLPFVTGPPAQRVLVATATHAERAWKVTAARPGSPERLLDVLMDADTGALIEIRPRTFAAVDGARVFPSDPTAPSLVLPFPDPASRPSDASPAGWCDADTTSGNNVQAFLDRNADFNPDGPTPVAAGTPPTFAAPYTGVPAADGDAAVINVFWALDEAHDRFHVLGFDEPSGAMQFDDYGRGGLGNDGVHALVQYDLQGGTNAYNSTALGVGGDGGYTYMVVGIYDNSGTLRDSALEADVLFHEYAHGVTTRLVGDDPGCMTGVQPEGLSEGWSDFFAASFTGTPIIGAWISGNATGGLRSRPLDDPAGYTYSNFCYVLGDYCNRYENGEIWGETLWALRRDFAARHGGAVGVERAERLVVEGLRYTPCRPTYPEARDGILLADQAMDGGADHCALWAIFESKGLGYSASTTGPDDTLPVPGFDAPPECGTGASVTFDAPQYATDASGLVTVVDRSARAPVVTVTSSSGDSETLTLAGVPGGPLLQAPFTVVPGAAVPNDGILEVSDGDTLTATYAAGAAATARVAGTIAVAVQEHYVWGDCSSTSGSDDDHPAGWYILPGFLDAGEHATLSIILGHDEPVALQDVRVLVESQSPDVVVLPTSPVPMGDIGPRIGTGPRRFQVDLKAWASPSAVPGEIAHLVITVSARGRVGTTSLDLVLDDDYVIETGHSPFAGGVETFDPGSPSRGAWTHEIDRGTMDEWDQEPCAGNNGTAGARNAQPGCAPYVDGQVAATLLSPPLMSVPADAVAYRVDDLGWSDDMSLWTDPANPYCDLDIVAAFRTTDPPSLPFDDPTGVYNYSPERAYAYYDGENGAGWQVSGPGYYSREPQFIRPGYAYDRLRLAWVFWGDAYDCGFHTQNVGHYDLDDVRYQYSLARAVPETAPCTATCLMTTSFALDPPPPLCPGAATTMVASVQEAANCAGTIQNVFIVDGNDVSGQTTATSFPVPGGAADGSSYAVYTFCDADPSCADYRQVTNTSPSHPGVGGPWPDSLRVSKSGPQVSFTFRGGAAPAAYGLYVATSRADLVAGPAGWPLAGRVDGEGLDGSARWDAGPTSLPSGTSYYQVLARDPCTDAPRFP